MVVRAHERRVPSCSAENLARAVRDYLVHVHVEGGSGARLIGVDHEVPVECSGEHLLGGLEDGLTLLPVERAHFHVGAGGRDLDARRGPHHLDMEALAADREVPDRAGGLDAVVGVGGDFERPQGIALDPGLRP